MRDCMVVDASVAAKWFLRDVMETNIDVANDILLALLTGDLELHAPKTIRYEVCGLLAKACRVPLRGTATKRLEKKDAIGHVRDFFRLPIQIHEATVEEEVEAVEMAADYRKSYYDMSYVRLARQLNCQCCTGDENVAQAVSRGFPHAHVVVLSMLRRP